METPETVTGPVPVLVSVSDREEGVLTFTLPKVSDEGVAVSGPGVVPVPLKGTVRVGFVALPVTVMEPLAVPATVGAKVAFSCLVAPPARTKGVVTDVNENPLPEIETAETVTETVPVLVNVTV